MGSNDHIRLAALPPRPDLADLRSLAAQARRDGQIIRVHPETLEAASDVVHGPICHTPVENVVAAAGGAWHLDEAVPVCTVVLYDA
jgi:hypothetical protein